MTVKVVDPDRNLKRRNFILNVFEGGTYISANGFAAVQTVLPALIARLGGSNLEVGAVMVAGFSFQFLPQIFSARFAEASPWKKPGTLLYGLLQRCVMILMGVMLWLLGGRYPSLTLTLVLVLYAVNQAFSGIASPFWVDFIAKLTPPHWRGRLIGFRTSMGGGGGFVAGLILTGILASISFPGNFALAFVLAGLLQSVSLVIQSRVVESTASEVAPREPLVSYILTLLEIIRRGREFFLFIVAMALFILGSMAVPFYTVYAVRQLQAPEEMIGAYTTMMVVIQIGSALVTGIVADRYGNKVALMIAGGGLALASFIALITTSPALFLIVFLFLGVNVGSEVMSRYNMAIDFAPERRRSTFVGLVNTILAPMYLAGILGGIVGDLFGYHAVFLISLVCAGSGVLVLWFFVKDPGSALRRRLRRAGA